MMKQAVLLGCYLTVSVYALARADNLASSESDQVKIDNERVTVSDITLDPGKPELMDEHNHDFVTLYLVGGKFRITDANGRSRVVTRRSGNATFTPEGSEKLEEVISGRPARIFVVDLKSYPSRPAINASKYPDAFPRPGSTKVLENEHIVVWDNVWVPGVPTPMHYHYREAVVLYQQDGSLKSTSPQGESVVASCTRGMVKFFKADRTHTEELENGKQSAIILELK
jgi:hypothetical protein